MKNLNINQKIKSLMKLKSKTNQDIANALNMRYASFTNKINQKNFITQDLIRIAKETNTTLIFIDNETGNPVIIFDENDIEEK